MNIHADYKPQGMELSRIMLTLHKAMIFLDNADK